MSALTLRMGRWSVRWPRRLVVVNLLLAALVVGLAGLRLLSGAYPVTMGDVMAALSGQADPVVQMIVLENRLGRMLAVLGVGLALGLAGELVQTLLRNPLASPDIIGFTAGAGCGAVLSVALTGGAGAVLAGALGGGVLAAALVVLLSWQRGIAPGQVVLMGIGVTLSLSVLSDLLMTRVDANSAADLMKWLVGSFETRPLPIVSGFCAAVLVLAGLGLWMQFALGRVALGDHVARSLGLRPDRVRLGVLALAVLLVALAVAMAGPIPFIAFVAGPIAHGLNRAPRPTLLTAGLIGAGLALGADMVTGALPDGLTLPAGVFTALFGAPVLVWVLLMQSRKRPS